MWENPTCRPSGQKSLRAPVVSDQLPEAVETFSSSRSEHPFIRMEWGRVLKLPAAVGNGRAERDRLDLLLLTMPHGAGDGAWGCSVGGGHYLVKLS